MMEARSGFSPGRAFCRTIVPAYAAKHAVKD